MEYPVSLVSSHLPPQNLLLRLGLASLVLAWVALLVWLISPVLMLCVLTGTVAYFVFPLFGLLLRHRWPRGLAALCVALGLLLGWVLALGLLLPLFHNQFELAYALWPAALARLQTSLSGWVERGQWLEHFQNDTLGYLSSNAKEVLGWLLAPLRASGDMALKGAVYMVLVPVLLFYLLKDGPLAWQKLLARLPSNARESIQGFTQEADQVLGQYLRGQLWVVVYLVAYYSLALGLCGLEAALFLGILTGCAVVLPYVGFALGLLLALLFALLQWPLGHALLVVGGVYGFGQFLESFILTPRLVGGRIGVHPGVLILALLLLGYWLGFAGVLLALPTSGLLALALRRFGRFGKPCSN